VNDIDAKLRINFAYKAGGIGELEKALILYNIIDDKDIGSYLNDRLEEMKQ